MQKRWKVCLFSWFRDPKSTPKWPQDDPGRSRGSQGAHWRLPGSPGRVLASHFGPPGPPPGEPFGLHFECLFGYIFPSNFEVTFWRILGRILAPFGHHFGSQNRPRSPLGTKRSIFKNPCFPYVKPYFSSLEAPRSSQNRSRKRLEISILFLLDLCAQNVSKMTPTWGQKGARNVQKSLRKSIKIF